MYFRPFGNLIAEIEIPIDAKVHKEPCKLKADKIIIKSIVDESEFYANLPYEFWCSMIGKLHIY
jgi:hypothetical protein